MSDSNTATSPLAEQKIYKTKFCFAVIPALISLSSVLLSVFSSIITHVVYNVWSEDQGIFTIASSIISVLCWLAFTVILFIKRPNILVPVSYGVICFLPTLVSVIGNSIISQREGWVYTLGIQFVINLILKIITVAICVLFVLKAPPIKEFMKKTAVIWSVAVPLTTFTVKTIFYISNFNFDLLAEDPTYFINIAVSFLNNSLEASILFLLYRWLTNPYKEVRPTQQRPATAIQYTQPVAVPVQPQPRVPVQVAPQSVYQPTIADEIAKYKNLFDSGAITQEEFDALKPKIINKQA